MLHKYPFLSRLLALLLLAGYTGLLYFAFTHLLSGSNQPSLSLGRLAYGNSRSPVRSEQISVDQSMLVSQDGGQHWTSQATPSDVSLSDLDCPAVDSCYASGDDPNERSNSAAGWIMLKSRDGGHNWQNSSLAITETDSIPDNLEDSDIYDDEDYVYGSGMLHCPDPTHCYHLSAYHNSGATTNGGQTWQSGAAQTANWQLNGLACPAVQVCYAIGLKEQVSKTTDGGQSWQTQDSDFSNSLIAISCTSAKDCMVLARNSEVATTDDGGQSWHRRGSTTLLVPARLVCPSRLVCYAAGYVSNNTGSKLLVTQDGGDNWSLLNYGSRSAILALSCPTERDCLLGLEGGLVRVTHDSGATWQEYKTGTKQEIQAISCPTSTDCFILTQPEYQ